MRLKNWLGTSILLAAFGLLGLPALAQQSGSQQTGDPVADAARKAREQQKTAPKPKHVFTDDDVKHSTDTGSSSATSTPAGGQPAGDAKAGAQKGQGAQGTGAAADDKKEDPATTWRKRFAEQRNRIATAEKELDVLQRELEKAQVQYYPDPQKALQQQNDRQDINDKTAKIDAKKQEIANLKQQLSDMEDQLRKSGGDPGWVR